MSTIEADDRGLLLTCPQCGQRNRLKYDALTQKFRCGKCQTALDLDRAFPPPRKKIPLEMK